MSEAIEVSTPQSLALPDEATQATRFLMQQALEKGPDGVAALERLSALLERQEDRRAAQDFGAALADFQAACPAIPRSSLVDYASGSGKRVTFNYASFEDIMDVVRPCASKHGFSFTFTTSMQGPLMVRTVTMRHRNGHAATADAPITTANSNPGMSEQQKWAAAETSASRRALVSILGLSMTDAAEAEAEADSATITNEQEATLVALIAETGADAAKFKKFLGVETLEQLRQTQYAEAVRALENKRKGGSK